MASIQLPQAYYDASPDEKLKILDSFSSQLQAQAGQFDWGNLPSQFQDMQTQLQAERANVLAEQTQNLGKDALDFSKSQFDTAQQRQSEFDALTKQVVNNYLDTQQKQSAQADDYINYMKTTFRPIEQSLASEATNFDTAARREELAGKAAADVEQAAATSDADAIREAARYGINPADSAFQRNLAGSSINKTIAKVGAMNAARTQARAEGRAFKFDVAGLGRNLPAAGATAAQVGMQADAGAAGTAAMPAANARADTASMMSGYSTALGAQESTNQLYAGLYDAQMQQMNNQQLIDAQNQSSLYGAAGSVGGAVLYKLLSSKRAKVRKGGVSHADSAAAMKKMPIHRWQYKKGVSADRATHVGPYAEDFKKHFKVGDGKTIHVADALGATMSAVKGIAKQVSKLESRVARMAATRGVQYAA